MVSPPPETTAGPLVSEPSPAWPSHSPPGDESCDPPVRMRESGLADTSSPGPHPMESLPRKSGITWQRLALRVLVGSTDRGSNGEHKQQVHSCLQLRPHHLEVCRPGACTGVLCHTGPVCSPSGGRSTKGIYKTAPPWSVAFPSLPCSVWLSSSLHPSALEAQ